MTLGEYIKKMREARGLNKKELASIAGISPSYLGRIENSRYKTTSVQTLGQLAHALKVPFDEIRKVVQGNISPVPTKTPQEVVKELNNVLPILIPIYNKVGDKAQDHYIFYPKELLGGHENMKVSGFYVSNTYKGICKKGDLAICVPGKSMRVEKDDICLYPDNTVGPYKSDGGEYWIIIDIIRHIKSLKIKEK